jgi:AraC-like DNA-binding protein
MARLLATLDAFPTDVATLLPPTAGPLADHVQGYVYRDCLVASEVIRPVSANTNPALVLQLGDAHEAFEYVTGRLRKLPEAMLVGPQSRRPADLRITGHHVVFVVCFQPAGLSRLFGLPDSEFIDTAVDASDYMGAGVTDLMGRLRGLHEAAADPTALRRSVEAFLHARLVASLEEGPIHRAALALHRSHGLADLECLADASGLGLRHFSRAFQQQFGMTPKRYARVVRFGYAMRLKLDRPLLSWADVSQEAGYYDQNHMAKEFKFLVGEGPSAFLKSVTDSPAQFRSASHLL